MGGGLGFEQVDSGRQLRQINQNHSWALNFYAHVQAHLLAQAIENP